MFKRSETGLTREQEALADTLATTTDETVGAKPLAETISAGDVIDELSDEVVVFGPDDRYVQKGSLGSGGMGEVHLCSDRQIGRDVALKLAHSSQTRDRRRRARFVREARVQGRLEHPAIVPVYDLAHDSGGCVFFTMKRISGDTLEDVLEKGRSGAAGYSLHKLLAAFVRICLAVDFAHSRGVVHRDLKPSNVMLGAFGEVYLLDWGVAKLVGVVATPEKSDDSEPKARTGSGGGTIAGTILGTPAYMAPEQIANAEQVDARADVYSLGAILFEILTLEPFHGGGSVKEMLARVQKGVEARPSVRVPKAMVPPELEAVCVEATARDPRDRFTSARLLADAIEAHLSGDRDLELRQTLAELHLERAHAASQRASEGGAPASERTTALREVGRAIALAPENERALRLLVRLLTDPPKTVPPEVAAEVDRTRIASQRRMLAVAAAIYGSMALLLGVLSVGVLGIADGTLVLASTAAWLGAAGVALYGAKLARAEHGVFRAVTIAGAMAIASTSLLYGVLVVVPALAAVNGMGHVLTTARSNRTFVVAINSLAILVPTVFAASGTHPVRHVLVDERSVQIAGGGLLWPPHALVVLAFVAIAILFFAARFASRYRDALTLAETRNAMHMWQLRGLVPESITAERT